MGIAPGANDVQASNTYSGTSLDLTQNNGTYNWTQVKGTFTATDGTTSLSWLTVEYNGVAGGTLLFNDVSVREINSDGTLGPELVPVTNPNLYNQYNQHASAVADAQVEAARANGVYLIVDIGAKEDGLGILLQQTEPLYRCNLMVITLVHLTARHGTILTIFGVMLPPAGAMLPAFIH